MRGVMVPITSLLERKLLALQVPLAVELPAEVLGDVVERLGQIAERRQRRASGEKRLH